MVNPFLRAIDALNGRQVRYVIVGGFAAYLHGTRRMTVDLDLVVDLEADEAAKAIDSLLVAGFQSRLPVDARLFADPAERRRWLIEKQMKVFSLIDPTSPGFAVDLFVEPPIEFASLLLRSIPSDLVGRAVRIASVADLIQMKLVAGRPQDLLDVQTLRRLESPPSTPTQ